MKQQPYLFKPQIQDSEKRITFLIDQVERSQLNSYPEHLAKAWDIDIGNGGFLEERNFYLNTTNAKIFTHAGLDVFIEQQTAILAPFPAEIISLYWSGVKPFQYGHGSGGVMTLAVKKEDLTDYYSSEFLESLTDNDWNYLLINLIHLDSEKTFLHHQWTTYDYQLNEQFYSVPTNFKSKKVAAGQPIAFLGNKEVNGGWAIHLHIEMTLVDKLKKFKGAQSIKADNVKTQFTTFGVFPGTKQRYQKMIDKWALQDPNKFFKFDHNTKTYNLTVIPYQETEVTDGKN